MVAATVSRALVLLAAAGAAGGATYSVSTLAGGSYGASDGVGANASFASPIALALAPGGDAAYLAEQGNNRVRIVWRNASVGSLAGGGRSGFASGPEDGNKSTALFYLPQALAVPPPGSPGALMGVAVFVSDFGNYKVRAVHGNGSVWTLAGGGASGKTPGTADGVGTNAGFTTPSGIACFGGSLFVSDGTRLRAIAIATGTVSTLAGTTTPGFANGVGAAAAFRGLTGLAVVPGSSATLIVAETWYYDIRAVEISTATARAFAGGGSQASVDGIGAAARFSVPAGVWYDANGARLLLADTGGSRVIALDPVTQSATTLFGGVSGFGNGDGATASFNNPSSAVAFADGSIIVADQSNNAIRIAVLVSASPTPSVSPSVAVSPSPSPTHNATGANASSTQSATVTSTGTPSPSPTPAALSANASSTPSASPGAPSQTASPSPTPSGTPTRAAASLTASPSPTATPSLTQSNTPTPTRSGSAGASVSNTPSGTPSPTSTPSTTHTLTATPTETPSTTVTPTGTSTPSTTPSESRTPSATYVPPSATSSITMTPTPSGTPSASSTPSLTPTPSKTQTPSGTPTRSASPSQATASNSPTPSFTTSTSKSPTATPSISPSVVSPTPSATPTTTVSASRTPTPSTTTSKSATASVSPAVAVSASKTASTSRSATPSVSPGPEADVGATAPVAAPTTSSTMIIVEAVGGVIVAALVGLVAVAYFRRSPQKRTTLVGRRSIGEAVGNEVPRAGSGDNGPTVVVNNAAGPQSLTSPFRSSAPPPSSLNAPFPGATPRGVSPRYAAASSSNAAAAASPYPASYSPAAPAPAPGVSPRFAAASPRSRMPPQQTRF